VGIDMYLEWNGQTEAEKNAQYCGYDTTKGNLGYLREAYHGEPYATKVLAPECWGAESEVAIPAATLRARLPAVLEVAKERAVKLYHDKEEGVKLVQQSFIDFVELAEWKEAETGKPCRVVCSY